MKKIAITGNIAAGKTTVENLISNLGYKVINADDICHALLQNDQKVIKTIKKTFCNHNILDKNFQIDRQKLGETIFSNQILRKNLENIIHPLVKIQIQNFFEKNKTEDLLFVSVPLLFESNMQNMFDKTILVCANEKTRLERIIKRNNYSKEHAIQRIKSQISQDEKIKLSDFIIDNNGNINNLQQTIKKILNKLS